MARDSRRSLRRLLSDYVRFKPVAAPSEFSELPVTSRSDDVVTQLDSSVSQISSLSQLNSFRTIAEDRETQYNTYDEMATDSVIAAALEIYADDATQYDEQGRVIWVESDDENIAKAGNRLLDILEIPERAWKHIYQACKYGDYYLKLYRQVEDPDDNPITGKRKKISQGSSVKIINDVTQKDSIPPYDEYVEDIYDPATVFDLKKRGKTAGYVEVKRNDNLDSLYTSPNVTRTYSLKDINVYRPDRIIHIMISENMTRNPETITIDLSENDESVTYEVSRGKSILYDVYPIQRELQLLEDSLLLNRLTRSSLIRLLEIEVGDMPKKEVNDYLRRMKNLIEQHIAMDKNTGHYKSYNSPGPIDNVIYIPVKNGKGSISINNLGGDVNIRDIADIEYFNNKRSGALKIPRSYLGDSGEGCLRYSTKVLLLNGQHREIGYLFDHREEYIGKGIMSCNPDGSLLPTKIKDIKQTRKNAKFVRVHLDNGEYFDVTPDHLCMTRDGEFVEAQSLEVGSSLMPLYDRIKSGRRYVWDNRDECWWGQYRLVALTKYGELKKGHQIHHKSRIKIDDDFDNLEQLTTSEHYFEHSEELHEKCNKSLAQYREEDPEWWEDVCRRKSLASKGVPKTKIHRENISKSLKGKPSNHPFEKGDKNPIHFITEETRNKISEANSGRVKVNNGVVEKSIKCEELSKFLVDNPDFVVGMLPCNIKNRRELHQTLRDQRLSKWISERHTCENCGKVMTEYYGSGRFCSSHCASSGRTLSEESRKKISDSRKGSHGLKFVTNGVLESLVHESLVEKFLADNPDYRLGRAPVSDEVRERRSKSVSGSKNPCYGKKKVNNGKNQKFIPKDEVKEFLLNNPDWELGGLKNKAPYNHKVVSVEFLDVVEDAYDLQVEADNHTFILDAGVFVHNSQLDNGGTLTQLSARYARTIKRIQTSYIRAITTMLNLFFIDKKLDYVNKFTVRMTSPSTQEDLSRNELISNNVDMISSIMSLTESFEGDTQKEILVHLISKVLKMPEISEIIKEDKTPEEEVEVDGELTPGGDFTSPGSGFIDSPEEGDTFDMSSEFDSSSSETGNDEGSFTQDEYDSFTDELP